MEKNFNQINVPNDTVRQLNDGLYQIQNELENIKQQVLQNRHQKKGDQAFIGNADAGERQNSRELDNFLNRNETILFKLLDQMVTLSNEFKDLKRNFAQPLTTDEIAKIVNGEIAEGFGTKFVEVKNAIVTDVKTEFERFKEVQRLSVESVEKKIDNQNRTDKIVENIAIGVEQKLELKFSEMFVDLNKVKNAIVTDVKTEVVALSNEVKDLKKNITQPLTTEEIVKIVNGELSEGFGTKFVEVKNAIVADVKTEFESFKEAQRLSVESVEKKIDNQTRTDQIVENIAIGVEQKLELKFSEMFFDLNKVNNTIVTDVKTECEGFKETQRSSVAVIEKKIDNQTKSDLIIENIAMGVEQKLELKFSEMFFDLNKFIEKIKVEKIERRNEIDENKFFSTELMNKITNRMNALTLKLDSLERLNKTSTQSILEAKDQTFTFDSQPILDRFDNLAEYVAELVGTAKTDNDNKDIGSNEEKTQISEKLNELCELINSKKVEDFRPIYEVLNELDEKLADIKFGLSDVMNKSKTTSNCDNAIKIDNDEVARDLNETIPRIIRESIANSLVNVDDSANRGSFEKIANQINLIFANEEQKFDEVFKKIDGIKKEIGLVDGINSETVGEFRPNEIEETLSSLRNELVSLSKLIADAEVDDDAEVVDEAVETSESSIPKAISDATKTLDDLTKDIL